MDQQPDTTARPSLRDLLKSKAAPSVSASPAAAAAGKPAPLAEVIGHTFKMMAEVERTASNVIAEALLPLQGGADRRSTQRAIQTLMCLSNMDEPKEDWERAAHIDILQNLREKIAGRVINMNRRTFERNSPEEIDRIVANMTPFRAASKRPESILSEKDGLVPGPRRLNRASQNRATAGEMPQEVEEIIFALAQFRLSAEKTARPTLTSEKIQELRDLNKSLQEVRGNQNVDMPENVEPAPNEEVVARTQFIKTVENIFRGMNPDEKAVATLESETTLFGTSVDDVGTDIATLQGIQFEEFSTVRKLEKMYDTWASTKVDQSFKDDPTNEELQLAVFHALRAAAPDLGKALTMNMVNKLTSDDQWVQKFREQGSEAVHQAKEIRGHVVLTEPENKLFGKPSDINDYLAEGKTLTEALTLVDLAESVLYSTSVNLALQDRKRSSAIFYAQKVISGNVTPEELKKVPMLAAMHRTHLKAQGLTNAVFKEVDGREKNLAALPTALREHEQITRAESAIVRLIQTFNEPQVQATIRDLMAAENENLQQVAHPQNEAEAKARTFCQEKIATLQAMADLGDGIQDLDAKSFETLLQVVTAEAVPKTLRQHALVTLCDNKSKTGVRIKTKEVLDRMENLCDVPHLAGKTRRDLGTLRQWKEKENLPKPVEKATLAKAICGMPKEIKRLIGEELSSALKACLQASPWQPPAEDSQNRLAACRQKIYVLRQDYKDQPELLAALEDLHQDTTGILDGVNNDTIAKVKMADAFADRKNSLHDKENRVLECALKADKPQGALAYMASWYNLVGNQRTLRQETGMQREWHLDPVPMAGARMQSRIENLLQIGGYAKAVATQAGSLAEAFLQHSLQERRKGKERWDLRVDRMIAKAETEIDRAEAELQDWEQKYNSIFDEADLEEEDLSPEERENESRLKTTCQRRLSQKTREIEGLYLKKERLNELKETANALNGAEEVEAVLENIGVEDAEAGLVNVGAAWERALANLAKNPTPINLPTSKKEPEVSVFQILEGAAVTESIAKATRLLKQASKLMAHLEPDADSLENRLGKIEKETLSENGPTQMASSEIENPQKIAKEIKKTAFRAMKEVEIRLWEQGKSIDLATEQIEAFLEENPEILSNRKEWVDTLQKTLRALENTDSVAQTMAKEVATEPKKAGSKKAKPDRDLADAEMA